MAAIMSAQEPATEKPQFKEGESVEVWWAGSYLPGEIVGLEENGWVRVQFAVNGREQTIKQPGDGQWVRKRKAPPTAPAAPAAGRPRPAAEPANPFATAAETKRRTWTDSTGKFKIEASFSGKEGNDVLLTRADGKTIKLPLAKLSKEDQEHVAKISSQPPPAENPFAAAPEVADNTVDRTADWSTVEQVLPQPVDGWPLAPDVAAPPAEPLAGRAIGL
ncbi:MAG TPA: SHD1 domain-containing protein, partial [Pirellulaceae bacterium]|nr:SHD1 domain-containing protein [Pirellulaceae bacterium]